ncbi:umecyanin-like [Vigna radiata var. radiata]|uniref:Umecyanin-like n=1 Tax=Vigna radiata var. radiata TaxID=3916 RepID=A0A1S3VVJ1_VIGRR|nr:umecyanin-like [Vigna radiata var. radiata]
MARSVFLMLFAVVTLLQGSMAQTRHVVGDLAGWTIPSRGAATYIAWVSDKTFVLGDTLMFNFTNGHHDVAKVTKSVYDTCNGGNTLFTLTSSPAIVALNETGEQYYICSFGSHCSLGQKLKINVVSRAFAPQPSTSGSPPAVINVTDNNSSATSSSPVATPLPSAAFSPSGSLTPLPQNSEAASVGLVGASATLLSLLLAFFC